MSRARSPGRSRRIASRHARAAVRRADDIARRAAQFGAPVMWVEAMPAPPGAVWSPCVSLLGRARYLQTGNNKAERPWSFGFGNPAAPANRSTAAGFGGPADPTKGPVALRPRVTASLPLSTDQRRRVSAALS